LNDRKPDASEEADKNHDRASVTAKRPWGSFELFTLNENCTVKLINVEKGKRLSLQYHSKRSEFWKVVAGKVEVTLDSSKIILGKGETVTIPLGAIHRIKGLKESIILEIAFGEFDEDDIVRIDDDFNRARRRQAKQGIQTVPKDSESKANTHSLPPATLDPEMASLSEMVQACKEEENIERKLEILRKINSLLPEEQRLVIPSLITLHYIDYALSEIENKMLPAK
jgi:mannose-6-phosphate isomerase-like protein (cupin superfamily)